MFYNATRFGVCIIAAFAIGALIAQAAQAAPFFHSEIPSTTIEGTQTGELKFVTSGGTMKCVTTTVTGTLSGAEVQQLTLAPKYESCTAWGFVGATVDTNECGYQFHLVEGSSPPTATLDMKCKNVGEAITITAASCVTTIPQQTGLKHVVFSNTGAGSTRDIDAGFTVEGVTYTENSACLSPGTRSNGALNGSTTLRGFETTSPVGIWVE